jgi:hypothetical protein
MFFITITAQIYIISKLNKMFILTIFVKIDYSGNNQQFINGKFHGGKNSVQHQIYLCMLFFLKTM